jgi:hypothetical protein
MSEPYAALAQVTIERAALVACLDAPPRPASHWDDWSRIGGAWHNFSWEEDAPRILRKVDGSLGDSYRRAVRGILQYAEAPALARCSYDEANRCFTFGTLTLSENLNEIVLFFTVARGLANHLHDADSGFALVHNYLWGDSQETAAVMGLGADGHSYFLDRQDDAPAYDQHVREARTVFDDMYAVYAKLAESAVGKAGPPVIDDLDQLR